MAVKRIYLIFIISIIVACKKQEKKFAPISLPKNLITKNKELTKKEKETWFLKDILSDTIPGLSLERLRDSFQFKNPEKRIIVAVLDTEVDIDHNVIKNNVWVNKDEIPDNGVDDDKNGYIDDINGWNFLGAKNGENNTFTSYSYTRVVKKLAPKYKNLKDTDSIDSEEYNYYLAAKKRFEKMKKYAKEDIDYSNMLINSLNNVESHLAKYFPKKQFKIVSLDSLKKLYPNDKELQRSILIKSNFINYGFSRQYMNNYKLKAEAREVKMLNLDYDERALTEDDPEDINDIFYGNNLVSNNTDFFYHGTEISGSILRVNDKVDIMPVCITPVGNESDKDIAVGIKYAVDNGASIINMSFGKRFSINTQWVLDAMKYAEEHNVLIVSSAGNWNYDLNKVNNYFPNDNINNGKEYVNNFILVGGITSKLNKEFRYVNSNYGNIDVDAFAPAVDIYTTFPNNISRLDTGTSLAASLTSGIASLIYQQYPNLKAAQIKQILMDSGLEFKLEVNNPDIEKIEKTIPINKLSKSGKVINAYNALIMADSISNLKKL